MQVSWLKQTRDLAPGVFLHHIFSDEEAMARLAELGNAGISWKISDPDELAAGAVERAHDAGLRVCLRAADSAAAVSRMHALDLDYLPTNTMHKAGVVG